MKKPLYILFFLCWSTLYVAAQYKIKVSEGNEKIAEGSNNSLSVSIYEAEVKDVEKAWKGLMKDYNAKVSMKKEIFADDALIKSMSENTMDIYAKIEQKEKEVLLTVAFDLGGAFLSSSQHAVEYKIAEKIIYEFAVKTTKEAIGDMLKDAEKVQGKLEKEYDNLVKDKERLHRDIEKNEEQIEKLKAEIEQAKKDIQQNEKDQAKKKEEVTVQKKLVEEIAAKEKAVK